jgi:BMFP domain-containing protein YqiC
VENEAKKESSVQQLLDAEIERNRQLEQRIHDLEKKLNSTEQARK